MLLLQEYRDYDSLVEDISHKENNKIMEYVHSSNDGDYDFTKTKTYREAVNMFKAGFPEVIPKMKTGVEQQKRINSKLFADIESPRPVSFFVGYIPNVPNAIQNLPNSMIYTDRKPMKRKTISVMYSMHGAWFQDTDWFINAGTALLSAIDLIEKSGIQTKLQLAFMTSEAGGEIAFPTLDIKHYGERYSFQKLSFPLAHPSMLRRIGFKWLETNDLITKDGFSNGYGRPPELNQVETQYREQKPNDKNTYLIDAKWINDNNCDVSEILKKFEVI